jgi:hypothetical protein
MGHDMIWAIWVSTTNVLLWYHADLLGLPIRQIGVCARGVVRGRVMER